MCFLGQACIELTLKIDLLNLRNQFKLAWEKQEGRSCRRRNYNIPVTQAD
jgi:hypothetical protein